MSQSQASQLETETTMTEREAEQLALMEERIEIASLFKDPWIYEDRPDYSQVIKYNQHEPHGICTGHLVVAEIIGKPVYRQAIGRLIARSPSMANLLEKALSIIEGEAERREFMPSSDNREHSYWREMRELANEIKAEIEKARGK